MLTLLLLSFFSGNAQAFCGYVSGTSYQTKVFNFGNVIVQRDAAIGTVVASQNTGPWSGGAMLFGCDTAWTARWELTRFSSQTSLPGVYQTNVPGIGLRLYNEGTGAGFPGDSPMNASVYLWIRYGITAQLVKVSSVVQGGTITNGVVAKASIVNVMYTEQVDMGTNKIIPVACSITTPSLTFPIGDVLASTFGSTVGTTPSGAQNSQNLGLDCDAQANINVSLQGTQNPDVSTTSVLALTGQGNADVAKGVGVQLLYNGAPLVLNNRIVLKRSAGGQETFPITARYYQTKTSVATGKANASATLDITYQ